MQADPVRVKPAAITREIVAKIRAGEKLSDAELVGASAHFSKLIDMLTPLGPTWSLALEAAIREDNRLRDYVTARGLLASAVLAKEQL